MNLRGWLSITAGVLVVAGAAAWYFAPHWIYRSESWLNLDSAYVRTQQVVLGLPVWWSDEPTFVAVEAGIPPDQAAGQGRWHGPPPSPRAYFLPPIHMISSVNVELDRLGKTGAPPAVVRRLRADSAKVLLHIMRHHGVPGQAAWQMKRALEASILAGGAPFRLVLRKEHGDIITRVNRPSHWPPAGEALVKFIDVSEVLEELHPPAEIARPFQPGPDDAYRQLLREPEPSVMEQVDRDQLRKSAILQLPEEAK